MSLPRTTAATTAGGATTSGGITSPVAAAAAGGVASPNSAPRFSQQSTGPQGGGSAIEKESTAFDADRRSEVSGAGYSAYSGHRVGEEPNYHMRLVRFYQKYNPEKIPRVAEFLEAYKGDEEELFRTLASKYGPEPEPSVISVGSNSLANAGRQVGVAHVPRIVSKEDGNCDRETPYYPGQRTIMESDLCSLLATRRTTHQDLAPAFVGYLQAHPAAAWNGLTYVTNVPVPIDEQSRFLGHLWAGSLSNTKTIVYDKIAYTRTVFHCNDQCSTGEFPHERWRLTLIRADHSDDTLYRVLWDPVLSPAAAAELLKAAPNAVEQDRSFFSFFRRSKVPPNAPPPPPPPAPAYRGGGAGGGGSQHQGGGGGPAQPSGAGGSGHHHPPPAYPPPMTLAQPTVPLQPTRGGSAAAPAGGAGGAGGHHHYGNAAAAGSAPPASSFHQPQQPHIVSTIDSLIQLVQGLEGRLTERLGDLDKRLQAVEGDIVLLKELSEQRQIEQLPEPWLEDGGGSSVAGPATRSHRKNGAAGGANGGSGAAAANMSAKEKAALQAKMRRRQHRRRIEQRHEKGYGDDDHDGTETMATQTSMGTSLGGRSSSAYG